MGEPLTVTVELTDPPIQPRALTLNVPNEEGINVRVNISQLDIVEGKTEYQFPSFSLSQEGDTQINVSQNFVIEGQNITDSINLPLQVLPENSVPTLSVNQPFITVQPNNEPKGINVYLSLPAKGEDTLSVTSDPPELIDIITPVQELTPESTIVQVEALVVEPGEGTITFTLKRGESETSLTKNIYIYPQASAGEILINEIGYEQKRDGLSDYIELINVSDHTLLLNHLSVRFIQKQSQVADHLFNVRLSQFPVIHSGERLVIAGAAIDTPEGVLRYTTPPYFLPIRANSAIELRVKDRVIDGLYHGSPELWLDQLPVTFTQVRFTQDQLRTNGLNPQSLSRCPDGISSTLEEPNLSITDPSPAEPNICEASMEGSIEDSMEDLMGGAMEDPMGGTTENPMGGRMENPIGGSMTDE